MASSLSHTGYLLVLIGGIIILLSAVFSMLGVAVQFFQAFAFLPLFGGTIRALLQVVIGIVCITFSRYVSTLTWGIILLILGIVAGNIGGTLVLVGAILGLISTTYKPRRR